MLLLLPTLLNAQIFIKGDVDIVILKGTVIHSDSIIHLPEQPDQVATQQIFVAAGTIVSNLPAHIELVQIEVSNPEMPAIQSKSTLKKPEKKVRKLDPEKITNNDFHYSALDAGCMVTGSAINHGIATTSGSQKKIIESGDQGIAPHSDFLKTNKKIECFAEMAKSCADLMTFQIRPPPFYFVHSNNRFTDNIW